MKHFTSESMHNIIAILESQLQHTHAHETIAFEVLNPDCATSTYAGSIITYNERTYIYRGYKAWTDLAQLLFCKMLTPQIASEHTVILTFEKLNIQESFHKTHVPDRSEKYGSNSPFFKIHKNEEPAFVYPYMKALQNVTISKKKRVLNLGVNRGDEFELIKESIPNFSDISFVGIDYSTSAIDVAKKQLNDENVTFITHDINDLKSLSLEKFDLIITIGTLQSPGIEFKPLFMSLVQEHLSSDGAMILGFPNSRWMDGEMIYGAKAPNYNYSEMSLVIKDIYFCKKYLQQHRFRVTITGKEYLFLTATPISSRSKTPTDNSQSV
jgi:2-polyprenyl-3-methyl-5-hydroxy-6-metoxy-1,4-benzoquinol methylase